MRKEDNEKERTRKECFLTKLESVLDEKIPKTRVFPTRKLQLCTKVSRFVLTLWNQIIANSSLLDRGGILRERIGKNIV